MYERLTLQELFFLSEMNLRDIANGIAELKTTKHYNHEKNVQSV
jgi:hypothetical protein